MPPRPFGFVGYEPEEEQDPYLAELQALQQEEFQPNQYKGSFLEPFAGLEEQQFRRPQSFGEGLLYGLSSGIGSAGTRAATSRQRFEQSELERRRAFDAERRQASNQLRALSAGDRRRRDTALADEKKARKKYEDETHVLTSKDVQDFPFLARVADSEGRIPKQWLKDAAAPVKPTKERLVAIDTPDGPRYVRESDALGKAPPPPASASTTKPATGEEKKVLGFYQLAQQAEETINSTDTKKINPGSIIAAINLPFGAGQALLNADERAYLQALRQFTEARLRPASGSAINKDEYIKDFQTFFKQPGDTQADIDLKARSRAQIADNLRFQAGRAFGEYYGDDTGSAKSRTKKGAQNPQERAEVKRTAIDAAGTGNVEMIKFLVKANPWLDNDPELEAALDKIGVPR